MLLVPACIRMHSRPCVTQFRQVRNTVTDCREVCTRQDLVYTTRLEVRPEQRRYKTRLAPQQSRKLLSDCCSTLSLHVFCQWLRTDLEAFVDVAMTSDLVSTLSWLDRPGDGAIQVWPEHGATPRLLRTSCLTKAKATQVQSPTSEIM